MLEVSQVIKCKSLAAQGTSIREISRKLAISRTTVRRYLRGAIPGQYSSAECRKQPAQEKIRSCVAQLLSDEKLKHTPRKQKLNAARIHRILEEKEIHISLRTVCTVVKAERLKLRDPLKHAYLPLEYQAGEDAQVDFYEAHVDNEIGKRRKIHVLSVRACFSRRCFRYAAPNQTREVLLEGLMQAFEFFGGVFHNMWFDNLTPAVKKVLKGRDREMQEEFKHFEAHYGFKAQFCGVGKGNEKGGVENDVRYSRIEGFAPIPVAETRRDVQGILDTLAIKDQARTTRGCEKSIQQLWEEESEALIPLVAPRFEAGKLKLAKVTNRSWIQTGTSFYSVPVHLVGLEVQLRKTAEEIVVIHNKQEVARHARAYGKSTMSLQLAHYLPLLARKSRGLDRAVPVRRWLESMPKSWKVFLQILRKNKGEVGGSRDFVEALGLFDKNSAEKMNIALTSTLQTVHTSLATLRYYLGQQNAKAAPEPIKYEGPVVKQAKASVYTEVLCG